MSSDEKVEMITVNSHRVIELNLWILQWKRVSSLNVGSEGSMKLTGRNEEGEVKCLRTVLKDWKDCLRRESHVQIRRLYQSV